MATSSRITSSLSHSYLEALLSGDRVACRRDRQCPQSRLRSVRPAHAARLADDGAAPAAVSRRPHQHQQPEPGDAPQPQHHRSARGQLTQAQPNGKKVLIFCGDDEPEELGGQICADLFECDGWTVRFAGGGVPEDEVLKLIGDDRPDLLVMFGTLPSGVPAVRKLIDYLREVNCCPDMQIMCCGGIYKRAEGLAEEIGADLYAPDAADAVAIANNNPGRKATVDQQTVGRTRRIRKAAAQTARDRRCPAKSGAEEAV